MTNLKSEIAVIGAGPTGSLIAWEIKRKNPEISVMILEEHSQIGKPAHCSGLIATDGLCKLGININSIKRKIIQNEIRRAKFVGPNNDSFEIDRGSNVMVVLDRVALDKYLIEKAKDVGSNLLLEHKVKLISFDREFWKCHIRHKNDLITQKSKILISSEGVHAKLAASIGLSTANKNWLFPAIQYEYDNVQDIETDCVELYFSQKYAPGFFCWFIPLNDNSARIGLAVNPLFAGKTRFLINKLVKKHPFFYKRLEKGIVMKTYGGFVPAAGPIKKTYSDNFMVVGDAAGQAKATTGGGVNIGGYCGRLAGLMAKKTILGELTVNQACREYQKRWHAQFEPDLSLMKFFRRMLTYLHDDTWNKIIRIAKDTEIDRRLSSTSIDLHGLGLLKYSLNPRVFIKGFQILPQAATSLFYSLIS